MRKSRNIYIISGRTF